VRAVWVTVLVGEGVMLAVIGHPLDHGAFHGQRSERRQGIANGGIGLERAVGQQTVKAHRDPQARDRIAHGQDGQIDPLHQPAPEQDDRQHEGGERDHDRGEVGHLVGGPVDAGAVRWASGGHCPPEVRYRHEAVLVPPSDSEVVVPEYSNGPGRRLLLGTVGRQVPSPSTPTPDSGGRRG
jgi:hypothetical protein